MKGILHAVSPPQLLTYVPFPCDNRSGVLGPKEWTGEIYCVARVACGFGGQGRKRAIKPASKGSVADKTEVK